MHKNNVIRIICSVVLVFSGLASLVAPSGLAVAQTDGNLVLNSGFETAGSSAADAANWTEGASHTRASDKFHAGGWAIHSTYRGTGTDTRTTVPIAVNPNTTYTYSGYIWRTNSTGGACMDMKDIAGERQLCTSASGSWQFLTGTWSSGSNTSVTLRLITDGSPTGDIWFDDISLVGPGGPLVTDTPIVPTNSPTNTSVPPTTPPTVTPTPTNISVTQPAAGNLVLNSGFETAGASAADAANWTEGANHTRASDKFHSGGWSLHSTYRGAGTDTRPTAPIAVNPNTTYTYSGYVWRTNSTGAACMDMNDIVGERQLCTSTSGSWQYLTGTWSSGSNTSVTLRLITDGSPTGDIWFDDISLLGPGGPTATPLPPTNTPTAGPSPTPTNTQPPSSCTNVTLTKGPILIFPGNNTQMQVSWQWSSATTFQVQWGTDQTYSQGNVSVTAYDTTNRLYKYVITGLTPGAKYYYRAVVGSQCSSGTFYAAPSSSATSLKFFAYGDTRTNGSVHDGIASRIINKYTSDPAFQTFNLQVGDWVSGDSESAWTGEWFNQANVRTQDANIADMGVRGNHEGGATYWKRYWPEPFQAGGLYWSFDYGPAHIVMLDQYTSYNAGSAQYNWLKADLAASNKTWKFIVLHEPGWTAGGGHGNNTTVQNDIQPLAVQYGVAIIFGGHNHYYARATVNGVQHLTVGGGGAPLYAPASGQPNIVKTSQSYGWTEYVINGNTLVATAYNNSGGVIETYTLTR